MFAGARDYCLLESFSAACEAGRVVSVGRAAYGRMREAGRCISGEGYTGCAADVRDYLQRACAGRPRCDVPVRALAARFEPCKKDFMSYLEAEHSCMPGEGGGVGSWAHRRELVNLHQFRSKMMPKMHSGPRPRPAKYDAMF